MGSLSSPSIDVVAERVPPASAVDSSSLQPVNDAIEDSPQNTTLTSVPICNVVTPVGMLGFGLNTAHTYDGLTQKVHNGAPTAIIPTPAQQTADQRNSRLETWAHLENLMFGT
jgi:hypothetical protein